MIIFDSKEKAQEYINYYKLPNAKIIMIPFINKPFEYGVVPIKVENTILVRDWEELKNLNLENELYKVEIDNDIGSGWIRNKFGNSIGYYLSTHTFYGRNYEHSTLLFQLRGFMIEIDNWDSEDKKTTYKYVADLSNDWLKENK